MDICSMPLMLFEELGKYLDLKGFIMILSVSRGLRDRVLQSNIKIRYLSFTFSDVTEKYDVLMYEKYKKYFTNLKVKLFGYDDSNTHRLLSERDFDTLIFYTGQLTQFTQFTDISIKNIALHSYNLRNIVLHDCAYITNDGLKELGKLSKLGALDIASCHKITDLPFASLTNVRTLKISDLDITNDFIEGIATLIKLEALEIYNCKTITDISPLSSLTNLETFTLFYCLNISDSSFKVMMHALSNIEILNITCMKFLTDDSLKELVHLTKLHTLTLSVCSGIQDVSVLASLPSLRRVDLYRCVNITDTSLKPFIFKYLNSIDIEGCRLISKETVDRLRKNFCRVKS